MSRRDIARQLASERKECGWSIDDLADKSGYSVSFLKKLECGTRNPTLETLMCWSESLGFDVVLRKRDVR